VDKKTWNYDTMTDYQIKFAPEREINPKDFVAAWNNTPECRAYGGGSTT